MHFRVFLQGAVLAMLVLGIEALPTGSKGVSNLAHVLYPMLITRPHTDSESESVNNLPACQERTREVTSPEGGSPQDQERDQEVTSSKGARSQEQSRKRHWCTRAERDK
jgi:hypothetical protein